MCECGGHGGCSASDCPAQPRPMVKPNKEYKEAWERIKQCAKLGFCQHEGSDKLFEKDIELIDSYLK